MVGRLSILETASLKALVTGAGGFLGRSIVEQLVARGDAVRGLSRSRYDFLEALGVEQIQADIRDAESVVAACRGVDVVFHTAAVAAIWGPWKQFYDINTRGAMHVVSGCRRHGVGRMVFSSSPSVTFDGTDQSGVDESAPYPQRWLCHYPHAKALAEQHVLASNGVDGLAACALRPHLIWGPRDGHLIPRLLARARSGQLRRVGAGENLVDMIYVDNAASAHLQAADALAPESPNAGKAYFISQGRPVNCWDWINEILSYADLPPVRRSISRPAAWAVGGVLEAVWKVTGRTSEPRMTRFLAAQLAADHYFDISAARRDFGYTPQVSTADGMQRLKTWIQQQPAA